MRKRSHGGKPYEKNRYEDFSLQLSRYYEIKRRLKEDPEADVSELVRQYKDGFRSKEDKIGDYLEKEPAQVPSADGKGTVKLDLAPPKEDEQKLGRKDVVALILAALWALLPYVLALAGGYFLLMLLLSALMR